MGVRSRPHLHSTFTTGRRRVSGLDGHECLVDAIVAATAVLAKPPVILVTSDRSRIPEFCKAAGRLPGAPAVKVVFV